jgi:hypothetical protein
MCTKVGPVIGGSRNVSVPVSKKSGNRATVLSLDEISAHYPGCVGHQTCHTAQGIASSCQHPSNRLPLVIVLLGLHSLRESSYLTQDVVAAAPHRPCMNFTDIILVILLRDAQQTLAQAGKSFPT